MLEALKEIISGFLMGVGLILAALVFKTLFHIGYL
jgi:hypothetical protein